MLSRADRCLEISCRHRDPPNRESETARSSRASKNTASPACRAVGNARIPGNGIRRKGYESTVAARQPSRHCKCEKRARVRTGVGGHECECDDWWRYRRAWGRGLVSRRVDLTTSLLPTQPLVDPRIQNESDADNHSRGCCEMLCYRIIQYRNAYHNVIRRC